MTDAGDLPLFRRGAERRAARLRRLHHRVLGVAALSGALAATIATPPPPRLVWNASASAPVGLWRISPGARVTTGDMVLADLPPAIRDLAARRHYLPRGVPLVKRVGATAGDTVCAAGAAVSVNGHRVAVRRLKDAAGRGLPWWNGCVRLRPGMLLLLSTDSPDSFDGRYFGPSPAAAVTGRASLLWAR